MPPPWQQQTRPSRLATSLKPTQPIRTAKYPSVLKKNQQNPLIPAEYIDVSSQKSYFIGMFLIIQAWKLQQCVILKTSSANDYDRFVFIFKFFIIDSLYLWLLPIFRIPMLNFNPFVTFIQASLVTLFTILIASDLSTAFSILPAIPWGVLQTTSSINRPSISTKSTNEVIQTLGSSIDDEFFRGEKVINILPKSTVMFNPFAENFCIHSASQSSPLMSKTAAIPLKFNTSNEIASIELIHTDFRNRSTSKLYNKKTLNTFKVNHHRFKNLLKKDMIVNGPFDHDFDDAVDEVDTHRLVFYEIPVSSTGKYHIGAVVDSKNMPIKIYNSHVIVSECPKATVQQTLDEKDRDFKCIGETNHVKFVVEGVPPLRLKYKKMVNEQVETIEKRLLSPPETDVSSPLMRAALLWDNSQSSSVSAISNMLTSLDSTSLNSFYKWCSVQKVELDSVTTVKSQGDYSYSLVEVEDGLGHLVNLEDLYRAGYHHSSVYPTLESYLKAMNVFETTVAYESPILKFVDPVPGHPLIENEHKELHLVVNGLEFSAHKNNEYLQKVEPIHANVSYIQGDSRKVISYDFSSQNGFRFIADKPGTYELEAVDLKYCPGTVDDGANKIDVFKALRPDVVVLSSAAINDSCLGPIGLTFDLLLTGVAPFELKVGYYEVHGHEKVPMGTKRVRVPSNRFQYNYEPSKEGQYEISFLGIYDSVYKRYLDLPEDKYTFKTTMRAKPDASFGSDFDSRGEKKLCLGSEGEILPVSLKGEAPFEISYDIVEKASSKRKSYTAKTTSNTHSLKLPVFTKGGKYLVSLTSVRDKSTCTVFLSNVNVVIDVRKEVPSGHFEPALDHEVVKQNGAVVGYKVMVKEGDHIDLPVKLIGGSGIILEYDVQDFSGKTVQSGLVKKFDNYQRKSVLHSHLTINKAGVYRLKSVKDSLCLGEADSTVFYNVSYFSKPNLVVSESRNSAVKYVGPWFKKESVCLADSHNVVDLVLTGKAPFGVDYTVELPSGAKKHKSIQVTSNIVSINILADLKRSELMSGSYKYTFLSVSDSVYSKSALNSLSSYQFEPKVILQTVLPLPDAKFTDTKKVIQTCSNNLAYKSESDKLQGTFLEPLVLSLQGESPFEVHLDVFSENFQKSNSIVLQNVQGPKMHVNQELVKYLSLGNHIVTVKKVVDGKGCVKDEFASYDKYDSVTSGNAREKLSDHQMMIQISDVPKISKVTSSTHICAGESVDYKFHGSGPFLVTFTFNGKKYEARVEKGADFKRLIVEPGTIEIIAIKDIFGCKLQLESSERKALAVAVQSKPKVEIVNPNLENIQEGDEVEILFKLEGVPPFDMVYKRQTNREEEVYHVNGIESNEYRIKTSLQGSYRAIELRDSFCEVRRE